MNTTVMGVVERIRRVALVAVATLVGCVDVNGGAVELSWSIRTVDGRALDDPCRVSGIARVRLDAEEVGVAQPVRKFRSWSCGAFHGTTLFEIPEGTYSLSVVPLCGDGVTRADATVPAPIVRDVVEGEVAQLNALLIVVPATGNACEAAVGESGSPSPRVRTQGGKRK